METNNATDILASENTHRSYEVLAGVRAIVEGRWIGRCKTCRATHKIEGRVISARDARRGAYDYVILSSDDRVYVTDCLGTDPSRVVIRCGDHRIRLRRVTEGKKHSKHECNAKCLASTGPNCDCRCKGANHGSNC